MSNTKQENIAGLRRRPVLLASVGLGLQAVLHHASSQAAATTGGPLGQPAGRTVRASHSLLTRVVRAGDRLVAMGERGLVVLSDDGGRQWRQASVPVSVTLTSACFVDARNGWMVGHSGVVLHTTDGGETWAIQTDGVALATAALAQAKGLPETATGRERSIQQSQRLVDEGADKPLLSVCFADAQRGMAVGAFGLAAVTSDGGKTWAPCMDRLPNPQGMHLYAATRHGKTWLVAGEQGMLMRSNDDGLGFEALVSPFKRSFFTAMVTRNGGFVVAGLLGSACRIEPGATAIAAIELPAPLTILSCTERRDGQMVLLAQGGRILVSSDGGAHFTEQQQPRRVPLISIVEAADGALVATSLGGVARLA